MQSQKPFFCRSIFSLITALVLVALEPALAAGGGTFHYRVDLAQSDQSEVSIVYKMVAADICPIVHVTAEGPISGSVPVATMHNDGGVEVFNGADDEGWWAAFLADNGIDATIVPLIYQAGGSNQFDLLVVGSGEAHLLSSWSADAVEPWGPCIPGPNDEPNCCPTPAVIPGACVIDVDQCKGGPLSTPVELFDALVSQGVQDPDGDPAIRNFLRPRVDLTDPAGGDMGVTTLSLDGTGRLVHERSYDF